jgi:hypothetical protein
MGVSENRIRIRAAGCAPGNVRLSTHPTCDETTGGQLTRLDGHSVHDAYSHALQIESLSPILLPYRGNDGLADFGGIFAVFQIRVGVNDVLAMAERGIENAALIEPFFPHQKLGAVLRNNKLGCAEHFAPGNSEMAGRVLRR